MNNGDKVKVTFGNTEKIFSVEKVDEAVVSLIGPRGAHAGLVKNLTSGRWVLFQGRSFGKSTAVTSVEVL